jgi:signal transduction histidine kinase
LLKFSFPTSRLVLLAYISAFIVIWALSWLAISQLRSIVIAEAENNLRNLNRAIAAQTELALSSANVGLIAARDWVEAHPKYDHDAIMEMLKRRTDAAAFLRDMFITGPEGTIRSMARQAIPNPPVKFIDRQWFIDARNSNDRKIVVGAPVKSRVNGTWVIPLVFHIGRDDFLGTVVGSLDPVFFQNIFADFDLGGDAAISLLRDDSTMMARQPHNDDLIGKRFPGPIYHALQGNKEAITINKSLVDGQVRILAGRRVKDFPFISVISMAEDNALKAWRAQRIIIITAAASLSLLIAGLGLAHIRLERQIAARREAERELLEKMDELARSNADLEQFAYVSSHDLREPLRMTANFLALIERRLGPQLDGEIKEFIGFAVDGARRMDSLILDLLEYSRIGHDKIAAQIVDIDKSVAGALINLRVLIDECQAEIKVGECLPKVFAHPDEILRLFQNLIGNSIKYRQIGTAPLISISAHHNGKMAEFSIHDNGIGIEPDECERIFGIFKRLHTQEKYKGTGIGLAICRKIIANHGGEIKASSNGPGTGTTITFTLPTIPPR